MSQPFTKTVLRGAGRRTASYGRVRAFTLIELMVTLAVLGVVTLVAFPSFRNLMMNNGRAAASNDLVVALSYARAQALSQHAIVGLCRSVNATTGCPPTCAVGSSTGWETGWLVFIDANGDGAYNASCPAKSTDETLLRAHEAISTSSITVKGSSGIADSLVFDRYGMARKADHTTIASGAFAICDSRGWGTYASVVQLSEGGRAQSVQTAQQSGISSCTPP